MAPTETRQQPTLTPTETREPATAVPTEPPPTPSPPPTSPPKPKILSFTVVPTLTQNIGERMTFNWEAIGDRAELCAVVGTGPTDCREVPVRGETTYVADEKSMAYLGFVLRVRLGEAETMSIVDVRMLCENWRRWFFDDPPLRCPADQPLVSYAAGQSFERGFMVWVEATDEFYVFYEGPDEQGFQVFHRTTGLELKPGASQDNRVGEAPPPGLYEPVSGFGLVWRGEVEWPNLGDARGRLGWATELEFGFDTAYQCSTPSHPRSWTCFLRGPKGEILVLSPDSTAQVRFLWEEW